MKMPLSIFFYVWIFKEIVILANAQVAPSVISTTQAPTPDPVATIETEPLITMEQFEHENLGCLMNSDCNKEYGEIRTRWNTLIKSNEQNASTAQLEQFRRDFGIPVEFWVLDKKIEGVNVSFFDSHCRNHQNEVGTPAIFIGETFVKQAPDQNLESSLLKTKSPIKINQKAIRFDPILVLNNKEILTFWVPKGSSIKEFHDNKLLVLRSENGNYYHLQIDTYGFWKIVDSQSEMRERKEVPCPTQLTDKFKEITSEHTIYLNSYCQTYREVKTGESEMIFLIPWSCP